VHLSLALSVHFLTQVDFVGGGLTSIILAHAIMAVRLATDMWLVGVLMFR
jgi:hypothetical protein